MTTKVQTELENFILWFLEIEEIPVDQKNEFINHVLKTGTIDKKSSDFIDKTLKYLGESSKKQADELKRKIDVLSGALAMEKVPEISVKERIVREAGEDMMQMASNFKTDIQSFRKEKAKKAEKVEEAESGAEVERLKAGVS